MPVSEPSGARAEQDKSMANLPGTSELREALQKIALGGYVQNNGRWHRYSNTDLQKIAKAALLGKRAGDV